MESTTQTNKHLKLAYILISTVMFVPVLLLPIPMIVFYNPMLAENIVPTWLQSIALLLLVSVSMDTMLYGITSFKKAIDAMLWVALFSMVSVSTVQNPDATWPLAGLFLIHSFRSAYRLFNSKKENDSWWLWLAWYRDISSATIIILWTYSLIRS